MIGIKSLQKQCYGLARPLTDLGNGAIFSIMQETSLRKACPEDAPIPSNDTSIDQAIIAREGSMMTFKAKIMSLVARTFLPKPRTRGSFSARIQGSLKIDARMA